MPAPAYTVPAAAAPIRLRAEPLTAAAFARYGSVVERVAARVDCDVAALDAPVEVVLPA